MTTKTNLFGGIVVTGVPLIALGLVVAWSVTSRAEDKAHDAHEGHHVEHLSHIKTRAEAEALRPGASLAMACAMCKHVIVYHVTKGDAHVKLMTIGQTHKCVCGGTVTVVGAGKGKQKNEEVKHVCSKCGDNAMFVCATKSSRGAAHHHESKGN